MSEQKVKSDSVASRITSLSPEKKALLTLRLKQKTRVAAPLPAIPRRKETGDRPLSFAQQRLWFLNNLEPGNPFYNIRQAVRLNGPLNVPVLERSLSGVVRRHESLRTTFTAIDGKAVQVISPAEPVKLPIVDFSELSRAEQENVLRKLSADEGLRPFDLSSGPLLRITLLRMGEQEHVVFLTMHHIISDGWSMGVFVKELSVLYGAFAAGQPSPLPELAIQYQDFASWQREWLKDKVLEGQLSYWKKQLAGLSVLQLPSSRPRPALQSFHGARHTFALSKELSEKIKALGRQEGATPFMTLLAGFQILLQRYSGQDDIVVGTDFANRNRAEIEGLIGFFINQVVMRADLSGDLTFDELLAQVRQTVLDAYSYQDLPFEKLVEELRPERSLSHSPLFQVKLVYQNTLAATLELQSLTVSPIAIEAVKSNFDITLVMMDTARGLLGSVEYSTDLFDEGFISQMMGHFEHLLEEVVHRSEQPLSSFSLLSRAEGQQLVYEWNKTAQELPGPQCLHELVMAQVERTPDAIALINSAGEQFSYRELDQRSNQLARYLRGLGVGPEVRVGLCLQRGERLVLGLLGILKAGGGYVALDAQYPLARLEQMLEDAGVAVVVTEEALLEQLPAHWAQVVSVDREWSEIERESAAPIESGVSGGNLAYVIYTSGSTGQPKGVLLPHRGLPNLSAAQIEAFEIQPESRILQFASISFDASISEIAMALCAGATLVMAAQDSLMPVDPLLSLLKEHAITTVTLPPSVLAVLPASELPLLKTVISAGEAIPNEIVKRWVTGDRLFLNAYGPTETTVCATIGVCDGKDARPSIGKPISNTQVYILDRNLSPVPVGVYGELYIGGIGVARGYNYQPELTAEKFIPNPFGIKGGERLYRTGDVARFAEDGRIEYVGRNDSQVKIRGFRIETGEIEAALHKYHGVQEVVVIPVSGENGDKRLAAYVLTQQKSAPTVTELRSFLKERIPEYMIPAHYVILATLPRLSNGKIDRAGLPAPEGRAELSATLVGPRNASEAALCRIWAEVFGVARVGIHDNFFELGGDSIISIQVVARANQVGLELSTRQLFQQQTVAELAAVAGTVAERRVAQGLVSGAVALTPIQQWFFGQQREDLHHYNQSVLLQAQQRLAAEQVGRCVWELLVHHDALRLRFERAASGSWEAEISGAEAELLGRAFTVVDLSSLAEQEWSGAIEAAAAQAQRSFELGAGPLLKVVLFEVGEKGGQRLLIVGHHLAVDGVSWRILLQDLGTVYEQLEAGAAVQLPAKTSSFQEWAERLKEYGQTAAVRGQVEYWQRRGDGGRVPVDHEGGANQVAQVETVAQRLSVAQTRALLQGVPAAYRTQINDVLLTALVVAFSGWSGAERLLVDLEGHGREEVMAGVDVTRTVGWFTSFYPVCLERRAGEDIGTVLKRVKEELRGVPGGGLGYLLLKYQSEELRAELGGAEVSFNYLGQFDQTLAGSGGGESRFAVAREAKGSGRSSRGQRTHLIEVNGGVAGGQLQLAWDYSGGLHRRETIEELARRYEEALTEIIAHCAEAVGYTPSDFELAGLSQGRIDELFGQQRGLEDVYPLSPMQQGMLFHSLFEPEGGAYAAQTSYGIEGEFNVAGFEQAWRRVIEQHGVLRTSFLWEGVAEPLQVVQREVELPLVKEDWRDLSVEQQQERLELVFKTDRYRPFDLTQAPLMRLTLIRTGESAHYFVMSFHHLLADGWSWPIILKDVFRSYDSYCRSEAVTLDAVRPYRDYIAWLQKQDASAAEQFWRENLRGFSAPTPLPPAHPSERAVERPFDNEQVRLSEELTSSLQSLARKHQLTLNTFMQGAWALLLSHYSREEDVLFGVTVSGRTPALEGAETMVGLFINTLPMRVRATPNQKLVPWLKQLQDQQVELSHYEYSPLIDIQGWSEVPRGIPLFESILVFEKYPVPVNKSVREESKSLRIHNVQAGEHTHYPITIEVAGSTQLLLRAGYDSRRFDSATVKRILAQFQTVLANMLSQPEQVLSDVRILPEEELQLLESWNLTTTDSPLDRRYHELFEEQVERTPKAIAVTCEGEYLSYSELNSRANNIGATLRREGVEVETLVGVLAERGINLLAAMLGIFKAGGVYLPLEPRYPKQRIAQLLQQSRAPLVLATRDFVTPLSSAIEGLPVAERPRIICIEDLLEGNQYVENLPLRSSPQNLAYVIYTSGSTGVPKGAMVEHVGMLNHIFAKISALNLTETDLVAQTASQCFDISVWQFLTALLIGGRVIIFNDEITHDPSRLLQEVEAEGVTILETVPSFLATLLADKTSDYHSLSQLRWLIPTGEALPTEVCRQWLNIYPQIPMLNAYGPTECSDDVTHYAIFEPPSREIARIPIGRPVDNTRIYIVDERLSQLGIGVIGELCVGGVGVGRGYLHDEKRTSEAFCRDPFVSNDNARLYRTGDLARYLPDGNIEFLGRKDHQVKIRGFRIELGEIEAALCAHPSVREAIVLAREDVPGDKRLVGYVVASQDQKIETGELRNFLKEGLPDYMVPSALVELNQLPLTPNGKVDRRALPAPDYAQNEPTEATAPPLNPIEEVLSGIWIEVLRVKQVNVRDNFFELGGQSLLATQVISRIRETFAIEIPLRAIFEAQTIAELAERVEELISVCAGSRMPPLVRVPSKERMPLSFAQQRLWFISQLEPDNPFYNITRAVRLSGEFKIGALEQSVAIIVNRHEVLRTTFDAVAGQPFQIIHPVRPVILPIIDLTNLSENEREDAVKRLATEEAQRPFDLASEMMLRVRVVGLGAQDHAVLLTMHHIASDGWSMGILLHELTTLYDSFCKGEEVKLPPLPVQYVDYAAWQREWLQGEVLEEQLSYWQQRLGSGSPVLQLPLDKPRPLIQDYSGASRLFVLPEELSERIRKLGRQEGTTLFMTLLAAFQTLLYRYTGQEDISVGTPVAGRSRKEVEGLIGFFVNTLVLRTEMNGDPTFRESLRRVREVCLGAYAHQDLPFEKLVEQIQPERDMSHSPLFQVLFVLQNVPRRNSPEMPELKVGSIAAETGTSKFDLTLMMSDVRQELIGGIQYNTHLFNESTIVRLIEHFQMLLEGIVSDPNRRLSTFPFMATAQQKQFISDFNDDFEELETASRGYASV